MSTGDPKGPFLYDLPPRVMWEFCRIMDALSDLDWTRFASEVLDDQIAVRLAERKERRTDWVMDQWAIRNGRVSQLISLLERLQLLHPRDVILDELSRLKPSPPPLCPPPPPAHPLPPPPRDDPARPSPSLPYCPSQFDTPPKPLKDLHRSSTCEMRVQEGGERPLPRPAPPPSSLQSYCPPPPQPPKLEVTCNSTVMCWLYEEVHAGTEGFSPTLQVGEGGFGVVYKATLRNINCAVKRLKKDSLLDWSQLNESFQTEVDKLSKFRHPNIIELLGFSKGPESMCLIYNYMDNRSLEDQLHNECVFLSWSQRVSVVKEASEALQFLHSPPAEHTPLIHGDVKSSNILLDRHMTAKLADFGLARFVLHSSSDRPTSKTTTVGQTATIRGTLAYLPDEYVREGKLGTALDVYSFGVVLLEVLTGRRSLEKDRKSGERYLKDLVDEIEDSPGGSSAASWRKQLDHRLITGGAVEPSGSMEMAALACRCLERNRKRRPTMAKVSDKLQDIHNMVKKNRSFGSLQPPSQCLPRPTPPADCSVGALSKELSRMGPLEDTYQPSQSSQSSSSSSSFCSLTCNHPLNSSPSLSSAPSSALLHSASSFAGPCETDESRGYSQYDLRSQVSANRTSSRSLSPPNSGQYHSPSGPADSQFNQPSVPTEDQYNFPPEPSSRSAARVLTAGAAAGSHGVPESLSPVRSLQSLFPGSPVQINPSKQHFLQKKTLYEEGRIQTPELLSSDNLYEGRSSVEFRGPEESDELDYLPAKRH